jgi:xanthine/CO dehydrogenase XdhC/CoxF family maturation factor
MKLRCFIDTVRPAPTLIMVGGVHIAIALTSYAKTLGYRTLVIDPRRAFGSDERFPHVDQLIQAWPDKAFAEVKVTPETAVALLTHDPKIDDPALKIILKANPFYIGALGSNKTHAKTRGAAARLRLWRGGNRPDSWAYRPEHRRANARRNRPLHHGRNCQSAERHA